MSLNKDSESFNFFGVVVHVGVVPHYSSIFTRLRVSDSPDASPPAMADALAHIDLLGC